MILLLVPIPVVSGQSEYIYELSWSYENKGVDVYELTLKDLGIRVFQNTSSQTVMMNPGYAEWEFVELNPGFLKAAPVEEISISPGEEYTVTARFNIHSEPRIVPELYDLNATWEPSPEMLGYIEPNELYPWDIPDIINLANNLTEGEETVLGKTLSIIEWFGEYSTYSVNALPKRPWATVRDPRGDCDDLGLLFVSMCRSQGIPAFLQGGLVLGESLQLDETDWEGHYSYIFDGAGWHAWAMVYSHPHGWLPVDLTMTDGLRPVDAINEAYYWRESTIIAWNITSHDYVLDEENQRDAFIENDIYWVQTDRWIVEEKEVNTRYTLFGAVIGFALVFYLSWRRTNAGG